MKKRASLWTWFWVIVSMAYFFLPLLGTFEFSLRAQKGVYSFLAYQHVFADPEFLSSFLYSARMAVLTIIASILLIVPTAYWIHLKLPRLRPVVELITLLPFVVPAIVLVFGMLRIYGRLLETDLVTDSLLTAGYVVLSLPYMYRAVDTGLRSIDVARLTEAAQSLGAGWFTILFRVIMPNLRVAILSGALITFATVMGELILASFLARPGLAVYMAQIGRDRAYEPAALAILSFALTWGALGLISFFSGGRSANQGQMVATR